MEINFDRATCILEMTRALITEHQSNKKNEIEVIEDDGEVLLAGYSFDECVLEITVNLVPDYRPYNTVSCNVYAVCNGRIKIVYYWYDTGTETPEEVMDQIKKSIEFATKY